MHFLAVELDAVEVWKSQASKVSVLFTGILMVPDAMWTVDALIHLGSL